MHREIPEFVKGLAVDDSVLGASLLKGMKDKQFKEKVDNIAKLNKEVERRKKTE